MDWNTFGSAILGAIIGGIFTLLGGAYQVYLSEKKQKKENVNSVKLNVLTDIMANRAAITTSESRNVYHKDFFNAMNQINVTFNDNKEVIELYEEFSRNRSLPNPTSNSNELLYKLIKSIYKDLNMNVPSYESFVRILF